MICVGSGAAQFSVQFGGRHIKYVGFTSVEQRPTQEQMLQVFEGLCNEQREAFVPEENRWSVQLGVSIRSVLVTDTADPDNVIVDAPLKEISFCTLANSPDPKFRCAMQRERREEEKRREDKRRKGGRGRREREIS